MDKTWLAEITAGFAAAIGAVERGNNRVAGFMAYQQCVSAIFATGKVPEGCEAGE